MKCFQNKQKSDVRDSLVLYSKIEKKKVKSSVWNSGGLGYSSAYKKLLPVPGGVSRNGKQVLPAVGMLS